MGTGRGGKRVSNDRTSRRQAGVGVWGWGGCEGGWVGGWVGAVRAQGGACSLAVLGGFMLLPESQI